MDRDVTLRLAVQMPNGAQAMRDMAQGTRQLTEEERRYQDKLAQRIMAMRQSHLMQADLARMGHLSPQLAAAAGVADHLPGGGGLSPSIMSSLKVAATVGTLSYAASTGGRIADAASNTFLSARDRQHAIVENLPVIGGLMRSFRELAEAVSGATQRLREVDHALVGLNARTAGENQLYSVERSTDTRLAEANARRKAGRWAAGQAAGLVLEGDRSTVQGEIEYRRREAMLGVDAGAISAQRDSRSAQEEYEMAQQQTRSIRRDRDKAVKERQEVEERLKALDAVTLVNPSLVRTYEGQFGAKVEEVKARELELEKALNRETEAGVRALQAKSKVAGANLARAEQELALTRQLAQAAESRQQSWGSMQLGDRHFALQAIRRLKQVGYDNLHEEEKGIIGRSGFGDVLRKEAERSGGRDPMRKEAEELLGLGTSGDLDALRRKEAKLAADVKVQLIANEAKLAEEIVKQLNIDLARLISQARVKIENEAKQKEQQDLIEKSSRQ